MPDPPPAPDDLDEDEKPVWRRGFAAGLYFLAGHGQTLAGSMERAESEAEAAESDETCPECEAELVEALGGSVCPNGCDPNGS